jgi:hypothetical protein
MNTSLSELKWDTELRVFLILQVGAALLLRMAGKTHLPEAGDPT